MFRYLLLLHAKILGRQLLALGLIRIAVLLLVIGGSMVDPLASLPMTAIIISVVHISRDDAEFLKEFQFSPRFLYIVEYSLLSLPALMLILINKLWITAALFPVFIVLTGLMPSGIRHSTTRATFSLHLPPTDYEWTSGLRKWGKSVLIVFVVTFITAFFIPEFAIVGIVILTFNVTLFYTECEPAEWIMIQNQTPRAFINHKLQQNLQYNILLILPLFIQSLILKPGWTWIALASLVISCSTSTTAVLAKYTLYYEGRNLQIPVGIIAGLSFGGWILPLIPGALPVLLLIALYYRANIKLNRYLYAYYQFYS